MSSRFCEPFLPADEGPTGLLTAPATVVGEVFGAVARLRRRLWRAIDAPRLPSAFAMGGESRWSSFHHVLRRCSGVPRKKADFANPE